MKKEQLINKRHLEKMEETKMRKYICPDWILGTIGHIPNIPNRCKFECKKFNKCKSSNHHICDNFEGWSE